MNAAALDSALHWLLRTSLEASVLILAVLGLRAVLGPRLGPAWRMGLWVLVGLKLLLPACIPAGFGLGGWGQSAILIVPPIEAAALPREASPTNLTPSSMTTSKVTDTGPEPSVSWMEIMAALWLAGVLTVVGIAACRQRSFEKKLLACPVADHPQLMALLRESRRLAGVPGQVSILLLPAGSTPAITGLRTPRLLLPADWQSCFDEASLRHVLLHELMHVRHRDLLWNWATLAVQALHWFNPLVWIIGARFQSDRELRCDAAVLSLLSPNERLSYGHTLLRIQETFFAPPAIAGLAPCVRNHPTLLQRITMIARPHRNRPWLQTVFTLAFGVITCYAFTTASASAEKDLPAKDRSREGERTSNPNEKAEAPREGDGSKMKEGQRDGDGGKKPGMGDREGGPKTGPRDGDKPRPGTRDGDRPKTGERDGEKPRTGERDGERPKTGERDGDRGRESAEKKAGRSSSQETLKLRVINQGNTVLVAGEEVPMNRLRGHLQSYLPEHPGASVIINAEDDVPYKVLTGVMDAVRDNGNKSVRISAE
ncbi:M56 family metallopeptidase [Prosthecobacter sp. SYSU 5D2]|uniref:M56 family metallopeptidase n=1 Tax=Prosthecobacter sp. SYSU 5D2 TaxID=3134134 RepID=UPI0031FF08AA